MAKGPWQQIELFGRVDTLAGWARRYGHPPALVWHRVVDGWDVLRALETPKGAKPLRTIAGQTRTMERWTKRLAVSKSALCYRRKRGWTEEKMLKGNQQSKGLTAYGKTQSYAAWGLERGINPRTLYARVKSGLTPELALTLPVMKTRPGRKRTGQ